MVLSRWDGSSQFERMLDEMDRVLTETVRRPTSRSRRFGDRPELDMYETAEQVIVKLLVPGAKPEDIDVRLNQHTLTIHGTYGYSVPPEVAKQATWHCREVVSGEFTDSVTIPATVDPAKVSASFDNGILTLTLQKTAETQAHRIPVISATAGQ